MTNKIPKGKRKFLHNMCRTGLKQVKLILVLDDYSQIQEDNSLKQYQIDLINKEQKSQEDYDKTVLTLSGGALGVTFAFIKDIVGNKTIINSQLIFWAWLSWGMSLLAILLSFFFSNQALREAITQVYNGSIYEKHPGGWKDYVTGILNALSGILFIVGIVFAIIFTSLNL